MISLIVAYAKNRVIGKNGRIPWDIDGEKKRFRELTTGNIVIMGRRTFDEIGFPLPNRTTIVVSSTKKYDGNNCYTVESLAEAFELGKRILPECNMYISGGEKLYAQALQYVECMYITEIDMEFDGDTYFPEFNEDEFRKTYEKHVGGDIPYTYVTYVRK